MGILLPTTLKNTEWHPLPPPILKSDIGVNLRGEYYWMSEQPWCNVFKTCDNWRTLTATGDIYTPEVVMPADAQGYPVQVPWSDGVESGLYPETYFLFGSPTYPAGDYLLRFKGTGTISFGSAGESLGSFIGTGGQNEFTIAVAGSGNVSPDGFNLRINSSSVLDPITDIEFIPPDCINVYQTQDFSPTFISAMEGFRFVRFMWSLGAWGLSTAQYGSDEFNLWSLRRPKDWYTQAGYNIAWEWVFQMCDDLNIDGYINFRHTVTDAYVTELSTFLASYEFTNPIKFYVGYSNETWNGGIYGAWSKYVMEQGYAEGFGTTITDFQGGQKFTAYRSGQIWTLMKNAMGATDFNRLVLKVLEGQQVRFSADYMLDLLINDYPLLENPDYFAWAPYFGGRLCRDIANLGIITLADGSTRSVTPATVTAQDILDGCAYDIEAVNSATPDSMQTTCINYGVKAMTYEGGTHFLPKDGKDTTEIAQLYAAVQEAMLSHQMGVYVETYLRNWDTASGGQPFCWFDFVDVWSTSQLFGLMKGAWDNPNDYPVFKAVRDFMGVA